MEVISRMEQELIRQKQYYLQKLEEQKKDIQA